MNLEEFARKGRGDQSAVDKITAANTAARAVRNCPFYGYALYSSVVMAAQSKTPPFVMFPTGDNQCALVGGWYAPCRMEQDGEVPEWNECTLVKAAQCKETV